ncbi:MAG: hypothetical protein DYG89_18125 [Caldilinea sp. CFX5]|nr:hypothetical protein [Caldilinea sp. CFX5]
MSNAMNLRVRGTAIEFTKIQNDAGSYAEVKMWFSVNSQVKQWSAEIPDDDAYTKLPLNGYVWDIRKEYLFSSPIFVGAWGVEEDSSSPDDPLGSGFNEHTCHDDPPYGIGKPLYLSVTGDEGDTAWTFHYQILPAEPFRSSIQRQELLGTLRSRWEAMGAKREFREDDAVARFIEKMLVRGYTLVEVDDDRLVWEGPEAIKTVVARFAPKKA